MKLFAKIGAIEISDSAVRIAVVKTGFGPPKVLETIEVHVEGGEGISQRMAQVDTVRAAVAGLASPPSVYVLTIPARWSILRLLTVPFRGSRKVAAAAPFELEPYLAIPIDELVVRFVRTGFVEGQTEVLAIGVRRDSLDEQIAIVEEAGIGIDGAMLDGLALTGLWNATRRETAGVHAVLHMRESGSILAVLENKKLTYLHRMDSSAGAFESDPEGVVRDLRNILRARAAESATGDPLRSLTVTGLSGAGDYAKRFEGEFDFPVRYENLSARLDAKEEDLPAAAGSDKGIGEDDGNRWSALIAAAASAAGGSFHLNFLEQRFASDRTQRTLARYGVATCLTAVAVILGFLGLVYADHQNNLASLDRLGQAVWAEFEATYPDLALERPLGDRGGFKSLDLMEAAAGEERELTSTLSLGMFDRPTLLDILREIGNRLPDKIAAINELSITVTKRMTISISGEVKDSEAFNAAVKELEESTLFRVETDRLKRSFAAGKETFVITASR